MIDDNIVLCFQYALCSRLSLDQMCLGLKGVIYRTTDLSCCSHRISNAVSRAIFVPIFVATVSP